MSPIHVTPKIEELRRLKKILDRQIESRTTDLNQVNESLREEITKLKRRVEELEVRVPEQTAERAQAEDTRRRRDDWYGTMADALPVLVWRSGPDKLCTHFNEGWLEFTGRTMEQELGNGWTEGVHPDDFQRCLDGYVSAFDRREPFLIEYRLRHRSGEYWWILDRGVPQFSSDGTFLGYIGGAVDTHDRKLAEQALRESEAQQSQTAKFNQAIMTNMAEGLYVVDAHGLVTYINPAAEQLFGWSSAELMGRKIHDVTHYQHPDGRPFPAHECAGLQVLREGGVLSNHEDVFIRKDGTSFPWYTALRQSLLMARSPAWL